MNSEFVKFQENSNGVATVTLARPEKHNAFDEDIIASLQSVFDYIRDSDAISIVVLDALGKSFSAGADLNWMRRMASYSYEDNLKDARALADMLNSLNTLPQPTVAKVQGAAIGGGLGLVACCDVAFASLKVTFCLSEVKLGLIPAVISPYVIEAIGVRASRRYFVSAETFSATEALNLGLLAEIVDDDKLDECIDNYIARLLKNGPVAMREAKQLVVDIAHAEIDESLMEYTSDRIAALRISEEGQEGLSAFLQKRPPNWLNRKKKGDGEDSTGELMTNE